MKFPVGLDSIAVLSDDDLFSPLVKWGDSLCEYVSVGELNLAVIELWWLELSLSARGRLKPPPSKPILPRVSLDTKDDRPTDSRFYRGHTVCIPSGGPSEPAPTLLSLLGRYVDCVWKYYLWLLHWVIALKSAFFWFI